MWPPSACALEKPLLQKLHSYDRVWPWPRPWLVGVLACCCSSVVVWTSTAWSELSGAGGLGSISMRERERDGQLTGDGDEVYTEGEEKSWPA